MDNIDEAELFKGAENSLIMDQTYTHDFQCVFKLDKYPFDSQVEHVFGFWLLLFSLFSRNARLKWFWTAEMQIVWR